MVLEEKSGGRDGVQRATTTGKSPDFLFYHEGMMDVMKKCSDFSVAQLSMMCVPP